MFLFSLINITNHKNCFENAFNPLLFKSGKFLQLAVEYQTYQPRWLVEYFHFCKIEKKDYKISVIFHTKTHYFKEKK